MSKSKARKPQPAKTPKPAAKQTVPPKPQLEGYSQEEAAIKVGCAQSTVSRAIARGDIEPLLNGRLPESAIEKLRELRKQDVAASQVTAELERRLLTAETAEREAKAELQKLRLERESGRYVELELVQRDAADASERIVAVLRAVPQRTALALECSCRRAAQVQAKISEEVERAIAELGESTYAKGTAA
jgi:IS30 family transposase